MSTSDSTHTWPIIYTIRNTKHGVTLNITTHSPRGIREESKRFRNGMSSGITLARDWIDSHYRQQVEATETAGHGRRWTKIVVVNSH